MSDSQAINPDSGSSALPYGTGAYPPASDAAGGEGGFAAPGGVIPSHRVEANTALIKLSRAAEESSDNLDNSGLMGLGSAGNLAGVSDEEDNSTEAASARIAQEYRRQVRIKRLAEEIQQAERDKRKDDKKTKDGTDVRGTELKRKEETAKIDLNQNSAETDPESAESKRRAEAMNAFKGAERGGRKSPTRLLMVALVTAVLAGMAAGVLLLVYRIENAKKDIAQETAQRMQQMQTLANAVDPKVAELQVKLEQERLARAAAEQKIIDERSARETEINKQEEKAKQLRAEKEEMLAEARRAKELADQLQEKQRKQDDEIRRRAEEASRIAREKMRKEQEAREAAIVAEHTVAATPQGEVKTNPPQPVGIAGKSDLPTGAVRLFCKASDPYGGRLTFHWSQVKGAKVEIADPNFSVQKDGKWYSQTYFIAREPGSYEFELSVKNEDGVETLRKYPIEVLPITQLK